MKIILTQILLIVLIPAVFSQQTIRVGAKHFNEGYILSEIISQVLESEGYKVERNFSLGGTLVCFEALKNGSIDVYPEYTGTITHEILKLDGNLSVNEINSKLKPEYNLQISEPYGFDNTYAFTMRKETAS